jgi:Holliday junction resolvase
MVKGSNAELELQKILWEKGYATPRIAGSGTSRYPAPDLLASNGSIPLAIECKSTSKEKVYVSKKQLLQLFSFSKKFGAVALIAVRFDREPWYLVEPGYGVETKKSIKYEKRRVFKIGRRASDLNGGSG